MSSRCPVTLTAPPDASGACLTQEVVAPVKRGVWPLLREPGGPPRQEHRGVEVPGPGRQVGPLQPPPQPQVGAQLVHVPQHPARVAAAVQQQRAAPHGQAGAEPPCWDPAGSWPAPRARRTGLDQTALHILYYY